MVKAKFDFDISILLQILQLIIPSVVDWFKQAHGDDPKYKDYTDEDMFQEVVSNIDLYVSEIDAWKASHPRT